MKTINATDFKELYNSIRFDKRKEQEYLNLNKTEEFIQHKVSEKKCHGFPLKKMLEKNDYTPDLSNLDLHDMDFNFTDFEGINLTNANLFGCNLSASNFHNCKTDGANIKDADLDYTENFKGTVRESNTVSMECQEFEEKRKKSSKQSTLTDFFGTPQRVRSTRQNDATSHDKKAPKFKPY